MYNKIHPKIMAKTFTITCYGETKEYPESQRRKMIKEFEIAMLCCDGSEAERYRNIYGDLTHIAQLISSNSLKFNHLIFREALSGALQILT